MAERPRILCIDDSVDFCHAVRLRLVAEGFEVTTVTSGHEGLSAAMAQPFDLILLDMLMPEQDGLTTYHELKEHSTTRSVPLILMTGMAVEGYWEPLPYETDGLAFVMGKPYDFHILLARVRQVLAQACGGA